MRGHGEHQRPQQGYDPRYGAASTSDAAAQQAAGMNPYAYAPNPHQYAQNPYNLMLPHLFLQSQAALAAAYHHHHQQQQYQHPQSPASTVQHRPYTPHAASPASAQPLPPPPPPLNLHPVLEMAQVAASKARDELALAGDGVTGWKVAQAALVALKAESWGSLGIVQLHDVPLLRDLFLIESKVNTFIHCYVAARKIVSIHDLEVEICKNEGVGQFEELGLGPFLQHRLVAHYFLVPADLSKVPKLRSEEIINCLQKFIDNPKEKVTAESFLDYLAEQKSVSGKEKLGVRVQSLGLHISFLRQARRNEVAAIKVLGKTSGSGDSTCKKDLPKQTYIHLWKQVLNRRFDEVAGDTSSEGDAVDERDYSCYIVGSKDADKHVSNYRYLSTGEEIERLGLKSEPSTKSAIESNKVKVSEKIVHSRNKRKYETPSSSCKHPNKRQKMQMLEKEASPNCFLSTGKLEKFTTTWKEACREHSVQQVLQLLANCYAETPQEKKNLIKFFSQYPGIGFLNVAVRSMGCGLLDSIYDAIHVFSDNKLSSSPIPNTIMEVMEIEPPSKENAKCIAKGANDSNEPDFRTSQRSQHGSLNETKVNDVECANTKDNWFPVHLEKDWVITEDVRVESPVHTESTVATLDEPEMVMSINSESAPAYLDLGTSSANEIVDTELLDFSIKMSNASGGRGKMSNASGGRGRLRTEAPDASLLLRTGRLGEALVYTYFVDRLGSDNVRWVNGETESGLPYDLVITRRNNSIQYVEVKATTISNKDWFYISTREWQFALEKGDEFTIARILVSGEKTASIEMFKNPHRLCQKKKLHLALLT